MLKKKLYKILRVLFLKKKSISIVGIGNLISDKSKSQFLKIDIVGNNNVIIFGEGTYLSNVFVYIRGNNHRLEIGHDCYYTGGSIWFEDNNCTVTIGDKTTVESAHIAAIENYSTISIGDFCMLSRNVEIRTSDGHIIIDRISGNRINFPESVRLHNHVWIGANVTILKGAEIKENSIIGIGSIVTSMIPEYCIAAGVPAKVLKTDVNWIRERN
jgi:acetyltransferase-like isoleucine patch superfamily enzyme